MVNLIMDVINSEHAHLEPTYWESNGMVPAFFLLWTMGNEESICRLRPFKTIDSIEIC